MAASTSMSLQLSTTRLFRQQPNEQLRSLFKPSSSSSLASSSSNNNTSLPCLVSSSGQHSYACVQLLANPHAASIGLRLDQLERYLNLSSAISKHVILGRLIQDVHELNALVRERSSSSSSTAVTTTLAINDVVDLDEYKKSESELRNLVAQARQADEALVEKYYSQVESTLDKCIKLRQNFSKVNTHSHFFSSLTISGINFDCFLFLFFLFLFRF